MRVSFPVTTFVLVCGQDVFLKQDSTEVSASRRRASANKHDCVKQCLDTDKKKHFKKCNHDGSDSCAASKCCQDEKYTCFMKNAYWSACAKRCKRGVPDSMGETWDCTPLSPSKCATLQPCVEGCWGSVLQEETPVANANGGWDCSAYKSKGECEEAHCNTPDQDLNKMWKKICDDNCPDEPEKKCPKSSFTACINSCADASLSPAHGDSCEHDGATNCLNSKCCQNPSDKCYTKNDYWAACTSSCPAGKPNLMGKSGIAND
jgi:hypothetical protein